MEADRARLELVERSENRYLPLDTCDCNGLLAVYVRSIIAPMDLGRPIADVNTQTYSLLWSYIGTWACHRTLTGAGGIGGLLWISNFQSPIGHHFAAYDGNGNVVALVSATAGTETARYEYGPFAEPIRVTGPAANLNPFRFSTKRTDSTTDLVLYEYRVYINILGRWPNRDPLNEPGFELLCGKKLTYVMSGANIYQFVLNNPLSIVDPLGLWDWPWKRKEKKCCKGEDATPYKDLADKFLTDLAAKVQEAEEEIGREKVAKVLDKLGKAKFLIDSVKSICDAKNPEGCDDFLKSHELVDCMLCCHSIHELFSQELAGIGFLITCKYACRYAD